MHRCRTAIPFWFDRADARLCAAQALGGCMVVSELTVGKTEEHPIAVVDDDPAMQAALAAMLGAAGLRTVSFGSAGAAVTGFAELRVDAVVLDLGLPDGDGLSVLATLRRSGLHHRTPVLVLTSRDDEETVTRGFAEGADDFMAKPVRASELVARLRRFRRVRRS